MSIEEIEMDNNIEKKKLKKSKSKVIVIKNNTMNLQIKEEKALYTIYFLK